MSPRTGRPKKPDARRICLNLRLKDEEHELLNKLAAQLGVTRTEVLMRGLKKMEVDAKGAGK